MSEAEALLVLSVLAREVERLELQNQVLRQQVTSLQGQLQAVDDPEAET